MAARPLFANKPANWIRNHYSRHTLQINGGKGLEVFRRVQAPVFHPAEQPTSSAKRSVIGVPALDALIGGGLFDGSTTMVVGISGAGKTVLAPQLLLEGAKGVQLAEKGYESWQKRAWVDVPDLTA